MVNANLGNGGPFTFIVGIKVKLLAAIAFLPVVVCIAKPLVGSRFVGGGDFFGIKYVTANGTTQFLATYNVNAVFLGGNPFAIVVVSFFQMLATAALLPVAVCIAIPLVACRRVGSGGGLGI